MSVVLTGFPERIRTFYRLSCGPDRPSFAVHSNNLANLLRGLTERVFLVERDGGLAPPPKPGPGHFARTMSTALGELRRWLPRVAPITYDQFVGSYTGRRKTIYSGALAQLVTRGLRRWDSYLSTFVKCEKVNFSKKTDPAPRVIQPRSPVFNTAIGIYLKHLEKVIYGAISKMWGGPTVMKGYNAHGTGRHLREMWETFRDPVAVGLDASRFDQHVSADALRWEHSVYLSCYGGNEARRLRNLLREQINNKGVCRLRDAIVKYKVEGCRMSGDMNTALGNCLLMASMVWEYCRHKGVRARLANNGDDCVVFMERASLPAFVNGLDDWFTAMGFTMKVETPVDVFEQIEFCQTRPVWTPDGWLMVRDPRVCLAKDLVSSLPMTQGNMGRGWATAIGECGMSLTGGLPVYQEFYSCLIRAGGGARIGGHLGLESGFQRLAIGMHRAHQHVHWKTRVSFHDAFQVPPHTQLMLEELYRKLDVGHLLELRDTDNPLYSSVLLQ